MAHPHLLPGTEALEDALRFHREFRRAVLAFPTRHDLSSEMVRDELVAVAQPEQRLTGGKDPRVVRNLRVVHALRSAGEHIGISLGELRGGAYLRAAPQFAQSARDEVRQLTPEVVRSEEH